tara:strand:+ start:3530 stop:4984 length:1455 start_codon:yes stop_codon:yes gene_type:complete
MPTLGPQIVSESYGNLLKFLPTGEAGVTALQVQITDGKGKVTPLQLATGSVYVSGTLSSSAEVVFSGLTSNAPGQYVSFDTTTGRLYYSATSSIQNVVSASYAVSASFAPDDGDWIIGSTFMTASGQENVYIPNSLRQGQDTTTTNNYAHAEGRETEASVWAHAEGWQSKATGNSSHAEGSSSQAAGISSHAEGHNTLAVFDYSHAEGSFTTASGVASHAEGYGTKTSANYSHAEGSGSRTFGDYSHAEGIGTITLTTASYSHAEGYYTTASGDASHAEGFRTFTPGNYSHAEGKGSIASGITSHAEGHYTVASGFISHAEGNKTLASGIGAHSGGTNTTASLDYQTVVGQHNLNPQGYSYGKNDTFVVGGGNSYPNRRDRFKVRTDNGEVIIPLGNNENSKWTAGSTQINNSDVSGLIPGLYFGEPLNYNADYSGGGTFRIIAFEKKNDDTGQSTETLRIQQNVGGTYTDTVDFGGNITAVFT